MSSENGIAETLCRRQSTLEKVVERPRDKRELTEELEIPRSTLDDIVRELEEYGLVEYIDGKWTSTCLGYMCHRFHQEYIGKLNNTTNGKDILNHINPYSDIDKVIVQNADFKGPHPNIGNNLVNYLANKISSSEFIRIATPKLTSGLEDEILGYGMEKKGSSLVSTFPIGIYEWLHEKYYDDFYNYVSGQNTEALVCKEMLSFGIYIFDEYETIIVIYADHGIGGLIINDSYTTFKWCRNKFNKIKNSSYSLKTSQISSNNLGG